MTDTLTPNRSIPWLKVARLSRRLSQQALAELTGMSRVGISHLEVKQQRKPHAATKRVISESLGYTSQALWPRTRRDLDPELVDWARALRAKGKV